MCVKWLNVNVEEKIMSDECSTDKTNNPIYYVQSNTAKFVFHMLMEWEPSSITISLRDYQQSLRLPIFIQLFEFIKDTKIIVAIHLKQDIFNYILVSFIR